MKNIISKLALAFLFISMVSCGETSSEEKTEENAEQHSEDENHIELTNEQLKNTNIEIGKAEMRSLGSEISVNGMIDVPPQGNISINIPYGGFLKYTEMLPGTKVKKGQLLAVVENPMFIDIQQKYLETLAEGEYLKTDFERQEILYKEEVSSAKVFQQAKSEYSTNKAQINAMEAKLQLIGVNLKSLKAGKVSSAVNIYSPVTGQVREVFSNIGKFVGPEDIIMDVTDAKDLHVELTVYESDITKVKTGQKIRFSVANEPENWKEAEVYLIGSGVRDDRSITVHGHLLKEYEDLWPGMFVNARIETGTSDSYTLPENAVVRFNAKNYIFISKGTKQEDGVEKHNFEMLEVKTGSSEAGVIQINPVGQELDFKKVSIVLKDANTLLATAKNSDDGGGHGH
ncbi:cobalt-zinc-cadmium efflux system membrane fusion protein [Gillisia mitskevichiae]|uniref:Cobalt-zinc-cadmium efflux system membrane fusion protein n=1 Tax=Gillisia mitskevichiae TaxID=270921 RepID=A0A495PXE2_9FLAO|nr:efflux RND transporter periplasmic adaptor subunit [Gillisia mitskevichiae]RKS55508.1 cobalt-zinc-cadmium efflux system membrane fusion protein [Gillisia mitskevichiae]